MLLSSTLDPVWKKEISVSVSKRKFASPRVLLVFALPMGRKRHFLGIDGLIA